MRDIAVRLAVSKSSVSRWVGDIALSPAQREVLRQRNPIHGAQRRGNEVWSAHRRAERTRSQHEGRLQAGQRDAFHAAGCMLYWAEGSKERNTLGLSNSDPEVLRFFLSFLRACFAVPDEKVRLQCNLFADHVQRQHEIEQFWLELLDLPKSCLTKSIVNVYSKYSQKKRMNRLPYGTCRLSVHSTAIVQHIYGAIQEYGGFDRPEWLG